MQIKNLESWVLDLVTIPHWIGLAEIAFVVGLLIPKYRKLTIYGIFIWTVIAVITLLQAGQFNMIGGLIVFAVLGLAIFFSE